MRNGKGCTNFIDPYKGEMRSNGGNKLGKVEHKDFCLKFHTEVGTKCVCRHQSVTSGVGEGDGDE